jgi:hypothetical protein
VTRRRIVKNSIRCKHCLIIIESRNVHECNFCACGKVGVDGGLEYLRRIGSLEDYQELSEWSSK